MRSSAWIASVVAGLGLQAAMTAQAQNWQFDPRLQLGYMYNDNYRLDPPGSEMDVSGPLLDAKLPLSLTTPVRKAEIAPRVRATYFPDEREEDSTDYFLSALFEQRTQRQLFGIDGEWNRQDVVNSELPTSEIDGNLGEPSMGDAGRVVLRNNRDLFRVQPYWQYDVSQRHRAEAGAYYVDADYEKDNPADPTQRNAQRDYKDYGVHAGWGYAMSQRSRLTFRGLVSHYDTTFDADAYGVEGEWRSDYSETAHVYLRLGGQETKSDRGGAAAETSVIGGAGARWNWPTTNLFADLTRSVGPNATGAIIERSELRLRLSRAIQPRFSILGGARVTRDSALRSVTYPDRDYITGDVGFDWRLTRTWSLVGTYRYIWQEYSDEPSDASSNAINLGIVYEPGRGE